MNRKHLFAALAALTVSAAGHATTIFTDNFDANALALNAVRAGWMVGSVPVNGTVDIIGSNFSGSSYDLLPGNGAYIDLDGSTGQSGLLSKSLTLTGGVQYTATFDLAGSQRGGSESGTVMFGNSFLSYNIASATGFTGNTLVFTPGVSGTYSLSFQNNGGDNMGALLDNVNVTAVPEPETYALMIAGLGAVGFVARRRKSA